MTLDPSSEIPALVLQELPAEEPVFRVTQARLGPSPGAQAALAGVAVLTAARISFVPAERPAPSQSDDPIRVLVGELWQLVRPALLDAFPLAQLIAARQSSPRRTLAGRGRPGIEVPLQMLAGVFVAGASPEWLGLTIPFAASDSRPAFTLYLELGPECGRWLTMIESAKAAASPRPDLERTYALYYLFRRLPTPAVYVQCDGKEVGRGRLVLGLDGPALLRRKDDPLLPYETIEAVEIAAGSKWRNGWFDLATSAGTYRFESPRSDRRALEDCAELIGELAGAPARKTIGRLAVGRIAFRAAWMSAAGAGLAELARIIFF